MTKLVEIWRSFSGVEPYDTVVCDCPMCGAVGEHKKIKKHLVSEKDLDVDLRPKQYAWSLNYLSWCHPPLYYMWHCRECGFTAADLDFESPAEAHFLDERFFRRSIHRAMQRVPYRQLVQRLAKGSIEGFPRSFAEGVGLHFLAIFLLSEIEEVLQDEPLVLGQYYLRTAWLFRDLEEGFSLDADPVKQLLDGVKQLWPDCPTSGQECLTRAAELFEIGLSSASSIKSIRDEIELIMLIARIWMRIGDTRKAKNLGLYSRERLTYFETCLEKREASSSPEEIRQIQELNSMQSDVLTMLEDA